MIFGSWVCLLAPLVGLPRDPPRGDADHAPAGGHPLDRRRSSSASRARSSRSSTRGGASPEERGELTTAWTWLKAGEFEVGLELLIDPLSLVMMLVVTGIGGLIVLYSNGYMAGDDEERRYFAYMAFFVFSMLLLVMGGNLLLLLVGWGLVGLASYLLIGFHHERASAVAAAKKAFVINALGDALMALAFFLADREGREPRLRRRLRGRRVGRALGHRRDARRARAPRRRGREVGADPLPHLAPGRDGGPDAGLGPDPRGDDGHRRRLPHLPHAPRLRGGAGGAASRRDPRARHAARRRRRRPRPVGHQARDRVLDDEPDRLHVRRGRGRRVRVRDVPPRHARLLQGAPLPRGRARDPPPLRRAGHPEDGRASLVDALHAPGVPRRHARARRDPAARRVLVEGRDPRLRARGGRRARLGALRRRARRGAAHRALLAPALPARLPRRARGARRGRRTTSMRTTARARAR